MVITSEMLKKYEFKWDWDKLALKLKVFGVKINSTSVKVDRDTANQVFVKGEFGGYSIRELSRLYAHHHKLKYKEITPPDYRML